MGIFGRDKEDKSGGSQDHRTASNKKKKNILTKENKILKIKKNWIKINRIKL